MINFETKLVLRFSRLSFCVGQSDCMIQGYIWRGIFLRFRKGHISTKGEGDCDMGWNMNPVVTTMMLYAQFS